MEHLKKVIPFNNLEQLKTLSLKDNTPIGKTSKYGDMVWNLYEENNERKFLYTKHNYIVDFSAYNLSKDTINDIKVFGYLLLFQSDIFLSSNNKSIKRPRKHKSAIAKIKLICKVVKHICDSQVSQYGFTTINSLQDITLEMLQDTFDTIPFKNLDAIKTALLFLSNYHVQKLLPSKRLGFNENDIKLIMFQSPKYNYNQDKTIPDELYAFISEKSSAHVLEFLHLIEEPIFDNTGNAIPSNLIKQYPRFREMFNDFKIIWHELLNKNMTPYHRLAAVFKRKYNVSRREFKQTLININISGQMLVLLYTGMRTGEVLSLKSGCVFQKNDYNFIKGTLIKNRSDELPVDDENWLIIPIVKDAVKVLEIFALMNDNKYLFSSFEFNGNQPYRRQSLARNIKTFIKNIDSEGKWLNDIPSPHAFRHTFIKMLQRVKIGLPFISLYVKHAFTEMSYLPNSTTGGYGNYLKNMFEEVSPTHKKTIVSDLVNGNFAGNGADKYTINTEAFFEGQALSGKKLERYLNGLAMENIIPVPTGIGLCVRDWGAKDLTDNPPCLKSFQCSQSCSNNIVLKSILPTLKGRLNDIENKLNDNEYQYLYDSLISKRDVLQEAIIALENSDNES